MTVGSNGAFSKSLTLVEGTNTIVITAKDSAGKTSSITRTVVYDSGAPVISEVSVTPNPASTGDILSISVKVTD